MSFFFLSFFSNFDNVTILSFNHYRTPQCNVKPDFYQHREKQDEQLCQAAEWRLIAKNQAHRIFRGKSSVNFAVEFSDILANEAEAADDMKSRRCISWFVYFHSN